MDNLVEIPRPTIDRALIERDLERLTELLVPAIEARLTFVRNLKWRVLGRDLPIGEALYSQLRGSPRRMTSDALGRLLLLSDDELAHLCDGLALELGAWRGQIDQDVAAAALEAARPAYDRLIDELG